MWSAPVTTVEPASEPISLGQAKDFLRIDADVTDFDEQLELFIIAAVQQVEAITGTRFAEQTVELRADSFADLVRLPIGPIKSVTISYTDADGAEQPVATDSFELFGAGLAQGLRPVFGGSWPSVALRQGAITVTAIVGYADVPKPVMAAILQMVADLFAFRETAVTGTGAQDIPSSMAIEGLLANHRIWL